MIFTSLFAGELEVDGDLTVTGNIQNQTIDSLLQVIQSLESQLSALQGGNRMETRFYELPRIFFEDNGIYDINLNDITGQSLDFASVKILKVIDSSFESESYTEFGFETSYLNSDNEISWEYATSLRIYNDGNSQPLMFYRPPSNFIGTNDLRLKFYLGNGWVDLILAVTAPFTYEPDIQQRKPGLQSKDKETVK